ncbi:MAG: hypothetical protein EU548_07890 [Promethearchaeota archaeon]|nr:MAG: hypothetical protein EU548_07890 [Candidatus Lokiarchaeota archaeon]
MEIFKTQRLKLNIEEDRYQVLENVLGIDMGQTLTKYAYFDNEELVLLMKKTDGRINDVLNIVKKTKVKIDTIRFTGGKAYKAYKEHKKSYKSTLLDEFNSNMGGINFLYTLRKKHTPQPKLIVSIGTGTSIALKDKTIQHLGGSAMGGGTFMGLVSLLYNINDYNRIIALASKGNRDNVDLKVSDIYAEDDPRIQDYFRAFTAASLGKINALSDISSLRKEDVIHSLLGIIGENIGLIATHIADVHKVTEIIFCGGLLMNNSILKRLLKLIAKSNKMEAIFLKNSEYAGAIGALIY